jgi:heme exporter protein A
VLAGMMARHRATGGLVIAATHQALGLDGARELRIEPTGPEAPVSRDASSQDAVVGDVWW